jgi:hypothetical protein
MKRITVFTLLLLLTCVASTFAAESGVRGRIAWRGELVEGIRVHAYRSVADIAAGRQVAESAPSGLDGTYTLPLPPGSYVLTAHNGDGALKPGDLFCYYSGSPIRVVAGTMRNVGFNLVRVPQEAAPVAAERSGIYGELSFQGEPLERAYLYVYKDPSRGFKGPGYFIQPVARGRFRLNLPPGDYYLLARKRRQGGQFGPIEIGDYFNYYYGNPVTVRAGEAREVKIEAITRLSMLEADAAVAFSGISGVVTSAEGQPQAGMVVFAYRSPEMTGSPDHFSPATGSDGRFELELPDDGDYYLLARQHFGGPAATGELYGRYLDSDGAAVRVSSGEEVTIDVVPATGN